jgi:hypothetical protein
MPLVHHVRLLPVGLVLGLLLASSPLPPQPPTPPTGPRTTTWSTRSP